MSLKRRSVEPVHLSGCPSRSSAGFDVSAKTCSDIPLVAGVYSGNADAVGVLLNAGAQVSGKRVADLVRVALAQKWTEIAKLLRDRGAGRPE